MQKYKTKLTCSKKFLVKTTAMLIYLTLCYILYMMSFLFCSLWVTIVMSLLCILLDVFISLVYYSESEVLRRRCRAGFINIVVIFVVNSWKIGVEFIDFAWKSYFCSREWKSRCLNLHFVEWEWRLFYNFLVYFDTS